MSPCANNRFMAVKHFENSKPSVAYHGSDESNQASNSNGGPNITGRCQQCSRQRRIEIALVGNPTDSLDVPPPVVIQNKGRMISLEIFFVALTRL
jgi:hypothetical protein